MPLYYFSVSLCSGLAARELNKHHLCKPLYFSGTHLLTDGPTCIVSTIFEYIDMLYCHVSPQKSGFKLLTGDLILFVLFFGWKEVNGAGGLFFPPLKHSF